MKLIEVCKLLEGAIWERKPLPNGKKLKPFSEGKVMGYDVGIWRFVEQNPNPASNPDSLWAKKARNGTRILWIFKNGNYYARYMNKQVILV